MESVGIVDDRPTSLVRGDAKRYAAAETAISIVGVVSMSYSLGTLPFLVGGLVQSLPVSWPLAFAIGGKVARVDNHRKNLEADKALDIGDRFVGMAPKLAFAALVTGIGFIQDMSGRRFVKEVTEVTEVAGFCGGLWLSTLWINTAVVEYEISKSEPEVVRQTMKVLESEEWSEDAAFADEFESDSE